MTAVLIVLALASFSPAAPDSRSAAIWLVTDQPEGAVAAGVRFGAEEARRTAELLGHSLHFVESRAGADLAATVREIAAGPRLAFVVLDINSGAACGALEALRGAPPPGTVIRIIARPLDADCARESLRVRLPYAQRRTLLAQSRVQGARVDEWHHTLFRFGAEQLNDRFERQTGARMNGDSWAGWFAAKVAAEALFRLPSPAFRNIAGGTIVFDGHKGAPLRFGADGALRQPIYLIAADDGRVLLELAVDRNESDGLQQ